MPLPGGTVLGVPTERGPGWPGCSRTPGSRRRRPSPTARCAWTPGGDVALGGLLRARFGDELADRLVDPLLGGVYAGRVDVLGLRPTMPALAAALDAGAAVALTAAADAAHAACRPASPPRPVFGRCAAGYRVLLDALADAAARGPAARHDRARDRARAAGWLLVLGPTTAPEALEVDAVVLAVPAPAVARLLRRVAPGGGGRGGGHRAGVVGRRRAGATARPTPRCRRRRARWSPPVEPLSVKGVDPLVHQVGPPRRATAWSGCGPRSAGTARPPPCRPTTPTLVAQVRADLGVLDGIHRRAGRRARAALGRRPAPVRPGPPRPGRDRSSAGLPDGIAVAGAALHGVGVPACIGTGPRGGRPQLARAAAGCSMGAWPASTTPSSTA